MNVRQLLLLVLLLGFRHCGWCGTNVTLFAGQNQISTLNVNTGQVAKIVSGHLGLTSKIQVVLDGVGFDIRPVFEGTDPDVKLPFTIIGPATISLQAQAYRGLCTIELSNPDDSFLPNTAVVIPADSTGPVNIILESSADLVTWTAALPGTYGANTTNRFFRVRAQRTP
jgi:hypothetical protein